MESSAFRSACASFDEMMRRAASITRCAYSMAINGDRKRTLASSKLSLSTLATYSGANGIKPEYISQYGMSGFVRTPCAYALVHLTEPRASWRPLESDRDQRSRCHCRVSRGCRALSRRPRHGIVLAFIRGGGRPRAREGVKRAPDRRTVVADRRGHADGRNAGEHPASQRCRPGGD